MKIVLENCKIIISDVYGDDDRMDFERFIYILKANLQNKIVDFKVKKENTEDGVLSRGAEITYEDIKKKC